MTDDRSLERAARSWIEAGPTRAPDFVVEAALRRIDTTPQERDLHVPRRVTMPTIARVAAAAAIGVLLVGGALLMFRGGNAPPVGVPASPTASPPPSSAADASPVVPTPPFGLALVDVDGTVREDLGMPRDSWYADLSTGGRLAFLTQSQELGFCGGCGRHQRIAVVDTKTGASGYVFGSDFDAARDFAWSPDGSRLAFTNDDATGNSDIYVMDIGSEPGEVTSDEIRRLTSDPAVDEFPAWTPDGATIVYDNLGEDGPDESGFAATQEIWRIAATGGDPVRLTNNVGMDAQPDVAADGTIAFSRGDSIWTMGLDGTDQRRLDVQGEFNPRWSPDGTRLATLVYDPSERARLPVELERGIDNALLRVLIVDVATGDATNVGMRVVSDLNPVSWMADGTGLLVNRYDDGG